MGVNGTIEFTAMLARRHDRVKQQSSIEKLLLESSGAMVCTAVFSA
jgi:hypothetical protein